MGQQRRLSDIVVRRLTEDDWPMLREVRLAALRDAPGSFCASAAEEEMYAEDRWRAVLRSGTTVVALLGEMPVGMAARTARPEPGTSGLGAMWVAPEWRGRGVSHRLLTKVVALARSAGDRRVSLWTLVDDGRARRFYEQAGFRPTGAKKPFPSDASRTIVELVKPLD